MRIDHPGRAAVAPLILTALVAAGCSDAPKTYPVQGTVVFTGGNVKNLAGGFIEFTQTNDPAVRAYGQIQGDGTFLVKTDHRGTQLEGAREGNYRGRYMSNGDDAQPRGAAVDGRFMDFDTAGVMLNVPQDASVTVKLAAGTPGRKAAPTASSASQQ